VIVAHFKTVQDWCCDAVIDDDNKHKNEFVIENEKTLTGILLFDMTRVSIAKQHRPILKPLLIPHHTFTKGISQVYFDKKSCFAISTDLFHYFEICFV